MSIAFEYEIDGKRVTNLDDIQDAEVRIAPRP